MVLHRRSFNSCLSGLAGALALAPQCLTGAQLQTRPLFIATWKFGLPACQQSLTTLQSGGTMLDAIEQGIRVAEADLENDSVGIGGAPNAQGVVQLDACIMDGATQKAGSVAALEGYPHPISVARRVMERTKHVMLVGDGAARFAKEQGFESAELLTPPQQLKFQQWQRSQQPANRLPNHDTIALVGVDSKGYLAGGCSTSGLAYKLPGRVGDSPILGGGLYVDGEIGAAGATGIGENVMRYCGSFLIVEMMRSGLTPNQACRAAIERIARLERRPAKDLHINFLALNQQGEFGAAGTDPDYRVAVVTSDKSDIIQPEVVQ